MAGKCYVTYWKDGPQEAGKVKVKMPLEKYAVKWFNPTNGKYFQSKEATSNGNRVSVAHPAREKDVVMLITLL